VPWWRWAWFALTARRSVLAPAFIAIRLANPFHIDRAVGSNSRDSSSGVRPERTNSTICRRNSGA